MIFPQFAPDVSFKTDISGSSFIDPVSQAIKKMDFYDGSTEFVDFGSRQSRDASFKIVQIESDKYQQFFSFLLAKAGLEIPVILDPGEYPFGPDVTGSINVNLIEGAPLGEQGFADEGNKALSLKMSFVDPLAQLPDYDFLIQVELNAWSVDEILHFGDPYPVSPTFGYTVYFDGAPENPFSVWDGAQWLFTFSRKAYEVNYYDFDRAGIPTFDGINAGETFYSGAGNYGGTFGTWDGVQWVIENYPSIDAFKPVILNSDLPGLKNSKFFWSSFTDLPIDNSDPLLLLPTNYTSGVISKKGIKFPSMVVSLEKGPSVEKIQGFSFMLENTQRINLQSKEINFFGATCLLSIWDNSQGLEIPLRSGENSTTGFGFNGFEFKVEPKTWNDAEKIIPSRNMADVLGYQGSKDSEDLVPQTFGSWKYAKAEVLVKRVEPLVFNGVSKFQILSVDPYDVISQTILFTVAINANQFSLQETYRMKVFGQNDTYDILSAIPTDTFHSSHPEGFVTFTISAPSDIAGVLVSGGSISIYDNDLRFIVDDRTCLGFGPGLRVFSYDSDNDVYNPIPLGVFEIVDDHTFKLGSGANSFQVDDDQNLEFGNPVPLVSSRDYRKVIDLNVEEPDIDIKFGEFEGKLSRQAQIFDGDNFLNRPIFDKSWKQLFTDLEVTGIEPFSQFDIETAYEFAFNHLTTEELTWIFQFTDQNSLFAAWFLDGRTKLTAEPSEAYKQRYNTNEPNEFYYQGSNGGSLETARLKGLNYIGPPQNVDIIDRTSRFGLGAGEVDSFFVQTYQVTQETKDSLRGANTVRLLGSLFFEHLIIDENPKIFTDFPSGLGALGTEYPQGFFSNVRVLMTLKGPSSVQERVIIDKTFDVGSDSQSITSKYKYRTATWASDRCRHVFYNLPDSLGGDSSKYYSEEEDVQSDYITLIYKADTSSDVPFVGQEIRNANDITVRGEVIYFGGPLNTNEKGVDYDICEVTVRMYPGSGDFVNGNDIVTLGTGISGQLRSDPVSDHWWAGRDLFKLDNLDVEELFNEENYLFGLFDYLEIKFIPIYNQLQSGRMIQASLGWANPQDRFAECYEGIFFETTSSLDLSDTDNVFVTVQGREDDAELINETPEGVLEAQIEQIDPSATLEVLPSANRENWTVREQLTNGKNLDMIFKDYVNHIFGIITYSESGGYRASSIDYRDHPIQPGDFKADFTPENIIKGSVKKVQYRDLESIHNEFEFNFHINSGKGTVDRMLSISYDNVNGLQVSGLGGDDDSDALEAFKASEEGRIIAELEDQFRVSRNFYNSGEIAKKVIDLPLFYDEEEFANPDEGFPVGSLVSSAAKWMKYFLFNSWRVKFEVNMKVVVSQGLKLGDLVTFEFDSITEDLKLFAFVRSIKPKFYDGTAEIEIFASVDPWVYSTFYDNIWDAGNIDNNYDSTDYRHTEFFKYPFRDTNQDGTFSDNGDLSDPAYDPEDFKFTDGSTADPDEDFTPLP